MFQTIITNTASFFEAIPFSSATWFVVGILIFCVWLFYKANKNPNSSINWEHLITDTVSGKASPYKIGYMIGVIVGTWMMITMAAGDRITFDMFGMYLAFLLGGSGVNSVTNMKTQTTEVMANAEIARSRQASEAIAAAELAKQKQSKLDSEMPVRN